MLNVFLAPVLPNYLNSYVTEEAYLPPGSAYHRRMISINVPSKASHKQKWYIVRCLCSQWFQDKTYFVITLKLLDWHYQKILLYCRILKLIVALLQDIEINCQSIIRKRYWFFGTDVSTATSQVLNNLDALRTYNILYQVENNQNMMSTPQSVIVTTGELGIGQGH